jgi:hypothetical protein
MLLSNYYTKTFGTYRVNNQIFPTKVEAVLAANQTLSEVEWDYNEDVFPKLDWTREPNISLQELYHQRAKQIREQYDYVILMLSGGGDSTNMLYSFLENGVHVDEVIGSAPVSGLKNFQVDASDKSAQNQVSETYLAQIPLLKQVSERWPNVKVTLYDYFEDIVNFKTDEWILRGSFWLHPSATRHYLGRLGHLKQLADQGKRIAKVYGIDKPVIYRGESGKLYNIITDAAIQQPNHKTTDEQFDNIETVFFYITPDMPEVMIKQCHVLCKWMFSGITPMARFARATLFDRSTPRDYQTSKERTSVHHRAIIEGIYPFLDGIKIWQAHKSNVTIAGPHDIIFDTWISKLHKDLKISQQFMSDGTNMFGNLNSKYFIGDGHHSKILKYHMKHYYFGHESQFVANPSHLIRSADPVSEMFKASDFVY